MGMRGNNELGLADFLREGVENFTAPTDCSPRAHNPISRQRSHSKLCCGRRCQTGTVIRGPSIPTKSSPWSRHASKRRNPLTELESRHAETAINPFSGGALCIHACSLEHRLHAVPFRQFDGGGIGIGGIEEDRLTGHAGGPVRQIVRIRKQDHSERKEMEAILELYMSALNMQ
jgi:hypothetical protein